MGETTTIQISEDNWQALSARKRPGDSFNDVISRLLEGGESAESGASADVSDGEGQSVECHHCGYEWDYTGSSTRPTCPSCKGTAKVE